jgi:hypothetical protein
LQDLIQQEVIEISLNVEIDNKENIKEVKEDSIFEIIQTDKKKEIIQEKLQLLQEIENLYFGEDEVFSQNLEKYYQDKN